jgi:hypothetical protein
LCVRSVTVVPPDPAIGVAFGHAATPPSQGRDRCTGIIARGTVVDGG